MSKINVFLDDYRTCPPDYILVETIDECISVLEQHEVNHLSLDHDLANKDRNGLRLVEMMVERQLFAERITIHSANSGAGKAMFQFLKHAQSEHHMPQSVSVKLRPMPIK